MRTKMKTKYTLDLKNSKYDYITATQRKYFKLALQFALDNNFNIVKVKNITYNFNFITMEVSIKTYNDYPTTYKLKRC